MSKPIVITDDSVVNSLGFRVLTDGGDLTLYRNNPILLYDHARRQDDDTDVILPIGTMTEITRQGSQLIATPVFDMDDDFAVKISSKYDKGIFNMASMGFEALEWSEDPVYMLAGQMLPTITKWKLKEVSITDIGSNANCCKLSYHGHTIRLSDKTRPEEVSNFFNSNKSQPTMKKVITALNASKLLTLSDASTEELVASGVETLVGQLSAKDTLISQKEAEIVRLKEEVASAKTTALKDNATILIDGAVAAKKILPAQKDNLVKLASSSADGYQAVKDMLDSMKGYTPVTEQLRDSTLTVDGGSRAELIKKFDVALKDGTLETLKQSADVGNAQDLATINQLWNAKFGKNYK